LARAEIPKKWFLKERLLQSQKLAALGELSAGISHEINNPLAIIRQEAEWMQRLLKKEALEAEQVQELQGSVGQVLQQVERCTQIIRNLLDFARQREPVVQAVDINRVVEDMTMLVEKEARDRNITIERHYDRSLPLILSDAPQLRQVILNLLTNASQAIDRSGLITITTRPGGSDQVEIVIQDTGCGIPAENLEKIFTPFFSTKSPGQGTGLGLAISHGLIQQLGGGISVRSAVGQGTSFTITLPRQAPPRKDTP
jgi:two-component system NtrC family sensor kinase